MCLTIPGRVTAVDEEGATVQVGRRLQRAVTIFTPEVALGDWVIVSAGSIVRIVDAAEAEEIRATLLEAMGAVDPVA